MYSTLDIPAHTNRLRYTDTRLKVIFALATIIITAASTSPIPSFLAFFTATVLILFAAKIKLRTYLLLLLTPLFFGSVSFLLMSLFFGYNGEPVYSFKVLFHVFSVHRDGVNMGLVVAAKTLAGSSCLFFLALTTPMTELFSGLKWFRIPDIVIELAMMIYRYIFVLLNEAERMWLAVRIRGDGDFRNRIEVFSMLAGTLFLRAVHQGEKLFTAMNSRCYDGNMSSLAFKEKDPEININALAVILVFELTFIYITIITQDVLLI